MFISNTILFPYIHNINTLLTILEMEGLGIPERIWVVSKLTVYATGTRYPGFEAISHSEYLEAIRYARDAVAWAEEITESD